MRQPFSQIYLATIFTRFSITLVIRVLFEMNRSIIFLRPSMSMRMMSSLATEVTSSTQRIKHKTPRRRATSLLETLKKENFDRLKNGRQWPDFLPGDSIQIEKLPNMSAKQTEIIKGVVIGISKKSSDTNVKLLNVSNNISILQSFMAIMSDMLMI
jgi:ribosomal protein L19